MKKMSLFSSEGTRRSKLCQEVSGRKRCASSKLQVKFSFHDRAFVWRIIRSSFRLKSYRISWPSLRTHSACSSSSFRLSKHTYMHIFQHKIFSSRWIFTLLIQLNISLVVMFTKNLISLILYILFFDISAHALEDTQNYLLRL